jgi:type II secretory pathway predicted ATPase ExeA
MYEEFYGLTEKPFSIQPDPSFLYWGRGHRLAYAMLEYGVVNQAGISVITGEIGCGKTTLVHRLLDQLSDTHTVALLSNIQAGRGELLSWVLMGFGEPYVGKTHVEMFAQLQQFFIREYANGRRVVLIIDEAQNLSVDMLEELRMLSNINAGKDQLLQLILVGQPQLKDLLSRPDMLQLAQRIGSDFHLTPLTREEVRAYIDTRMTIAGARPGVFTDEAADMIAEQSRGVPRVINIIADTALVYAFSAQEANVASETIRAVIRDKLDYGVFGLASSPDLKLAEGHDPRRASGFLGEAPASRVPEAPRMPAPRIVSEPLEQPRIISNLGVKFASNERTELAFEPAVVAQPLGGPSLYESMTAPAVRAPEPEPAPAPQSMNGAARLAPQAEEAPAKAEPARASSVDEIGVVVVTRSTGADETAHSAPDNAVVVTVAALGSEDARTAKEAGLELIEIDLAAVGGGRARNAGYRRLKKLSPGLKYVQFVEAGAVLDPDWLNKASRFMARRPEVAALEGRIVEVSPAKSLFARIVSRMQDQSEGEVQTTNASALFRADAFEAAGGFRGDIIADETADLCIRLRRRGAHAWRADATMALVEPAPLSFGEWRRRSAENGYNYAAGAALHGGPPEQFMTTEQARAVMWGAVFPLVILVTALLAGATTAMFSIDGNPWAAVLSVVLIGVFTYAAKIAAIAFSLGAGRGFSWVCAAATTLGHFDECAGVARYWFSDRKSARKQAP